MSVEQHLLPVKHQFRVTQCPAARFLVIQISNHPDSGHPVSGRPVSGRSVSGQTGPRLVHQETCQV